METNETVVITGASAGVGRATVREFAKRKARLGLIARGLDGLEATRLEVEDAGGVALPLPTDVSDPEQVEEAAAQAERELGPIDIWVNNAMISIFSPVHEMGVQEFKRVTEVNYLGTVYGTMAALKRMMPRNRGVIIQVGSALAYRGIPLQSAYCGSKHAIKGFVESLRCELLHDKRGVRLAMVQLPALNTPQFDWVKSRLPNRAQPVPPIFQPELAAEAIFWTAHHEWDEVHVGFPTVKAIMGNAIAPRLLDRYLAKTGYESQQTEEPEDPGRPDNIWQPVRGDHGAHGRFDARAHRHSLQFMAVKHRNLLLTCLGAAFAGVITGAAMTKP